MSAAKRGLGRGHGAPHTGLVGKLKLEHRFAGGSIGRKGNGSPALEPSEGGEGLVASVAGAQGDRDFQVV